MHEFQTVGELKIFLSQFPDDKKLYFDADHDSPANLVTPKASEGTVCTLRWPDKPGYVNPPVSSVRYLLRDAENYRDDNDCTIEASSIEEVLILHSREYNF